MSAREANRKPRKLFPLVKLTEEHAGMPIQINFVSKTGKLPFCCCFTFGVNISGDVGTVSNLTTHFLGRLSK